MVLRAPFMTVGHAEPSEDGVGETLQQEPSGQGAHEKPHKGGKFLGSVEMAFALLEQGRSQRTQTGNPSRS
jgi:hypothetical protein